MPSSLRVGLSCCAPRSVVRHSIVGPHLGFAAPRFGALKRYRVWSNGIDSGTGIEDIHEQRAGLPILVPGQSDVVGAYRAPGYGLRELPEGTYKNGTTLDKWYRDHVGGGPGSFLMAAHDYGDFARALRQKFVIEIGGHKAENGPFASR